MGHYTYSVDMTKSEAMTNKRRNVLILSLVARRQKESDALTREQLVELHQRNLDHGGVNGGLRVLLDNVQQNQGTQGHGQGVRFDDRSMPSLASG